MRGWSEFKVFAVGIIASILNASRSSKHLNLRRLEFFWDSPQSRLKPNSLANRCKEESTADLRWQHRCRFLFELKIGASWLSVRQQFLLSIQSRQGLGYRSKVWQHGLRRVLSNLPRSSLLDQLRYATSWMFAFGLLLFSGCGQVLIRQENCSCSPSGLIGSYDEIESSHDEIESGCEASCGAERLALMKTRLGWQGDRLKNSAGHCSDKFAECWYSSKLGQWVQGKRDAANAPPFPKFHPVPTHPALYPEEDPNADSAVNPMPEFKAPTRLSEEE